MEGVPASTRLNALTVDVEDYYHVAAFAQSIAREDWGGMVSRVERNTRRLLDIFESDGISATFFTLGCVAERHPELVREIHARGHEVASHGASHKLVYTQARDEFREETIASKRLLEDLTGAPVLGYRAASYSIIKKSLWALDIIAEAGFDYDSSIVPVRHDLYGIPGAESHPHELSTPGGATLVEFPPTTGRFLGVTLPVGGGGYFRLYPYWFTRFALDRINKATGQPFIFYLHPWEIDPDQPRIQSSFRSRFRHYLNLAKTEDRLRRLLREFRFGTVRQVLRAQGLLPDSAYAGSS